MKNKTFELICEPALPSSFVSLFQQIWRKRLGTDNLETIYIWTSRTKNSTSAHRALMNDWMASQRTSAGAEAERQTAHKQ